MKMERPGECVNCKGLGLGIEDFEHEFFNNPLN